MPINILQQPLNNKPIPAGNDIYYIVSGSGGGWDGQNTKGFKYFADVRVSGSNDKLVTLKSFQSPQGHYGSFNLRNIMFSTLNSEFDYNNTLSASLPQSAKLYNITFGVEYYTGSNWTEFVHTSSITSSNSIAINSSIPYDEYLTFDFTRYMLGNVSSSFLTHSPREINSYPNLNQWLYFINSGSANKLVNIEVYNNNNVRVGHYRYTITTPNNGVWEYRAATGYPQLTSNGSITALTGSLPINLLNNKYYLAYIMQGNTVISEKFKYNIKENCNFGRDVYNVYWLNNLGGYDSYRFNLRSVENISLNRNTFKQIPGKLGVGTYTMKTSDKENTQYFTNYSFTLQLSTGFITDEEVMWLKSLFTSPEIYIENKGILRAALINTNQYEIKKHQNIKIYSVTFEFKYSIDSYSQQQ